MIYYTADQHFGHENIIDYCGRPFNRLGKMERALIENYRKVVCADDLVYFLGDLTIKGPQHRGHLEYIVEQLPGTKVLILGNHDKFDPFVYVDVGFQSVHTSLDTGPFILTHDPAVATVANDRYWLCGHVHNVFKTAKNNHVINVGVDQWGFYPVSIKELHELINGGKNETNT